MPNGRNSPALTTAIICVFAVCLTAPALAAERGAEILLKTKAAEVSVSIDDAIRHNADLQTNLLTEGRRWADMQAKEAGDELKAEPDLFRDRGKWTYERSYSVESFVASRYASVMRTDYSFTGGAHPNTVSDTILWDDQQKKRISIRPFFTDLVDHSPALVDIRKVIIAELTAEKKKRGTYDAGNLDWITDLQPSLLKIGPVTLAGSTQPGMSAGLVFNYSQYAVGAYAEGSYTAFVSWKAFAGYLSPDGKAIFGGERPPEPAAKGK